MIHGAYALANEFRFWGIFWIDARSKGSIANGFATLARTFDQSDKSVDGAISWLQDTSHSWLLILDNADSTDLDLAPFLPAGKFGSILITTRVPECVVHQNVGEDTYERLDEGTAIELLLKACRIKLSSRSDHEDSARAVADLLGCHALALTQAGAAISQGLCDLREYKDFFLDQRQLLLECFPSQAQSEYGGVYATFEVSAKYLEARNDQIAEDALELLGFYASVHFTDFPEAAFEEALKNSTDEDVVSSRLTQDGEEDIGNLAPWHVSHLPEFMQRSLHDMKSSIFCFRQVRSLLVSLALVVFDSTSLTTRMHPVSHIWARDRMQKPEVSRNAGLNGLSVLSLSLDNLYDVDISPLKWKLQPHIEFIAHSLRDWYDHERDFHFQQSLYRLSYIIYHMRDDSVLLVLLSMIPIQPHESWVTTVNGLRIQQLHARYMCYYGNAREAVVLLEKIIEALVDTLAPENPQFFSWQHDLAQAYMKVEDFAKAIELLERIVSISDETMNLEHSHRLTSQHELARVYLQIDKTAKAIALLKSVVEIETRTLRSEHPDRLTSQYELASAYLQINKTVKVIALLKSVIKIRSRTLRPEYSNRLNSQHILARAYL